MKNIFITCWWLLAVTLSAHAQQSVDLQNKLFVNYLDPASKPGWIGFRKDAPYTADKLFSQQPELLNMRGDDEFRLFKTNTDLADNKHYKFAQYYKGVRVEGIEQYTHERNGKLHLANGDFVSGLNLDVNPSFSNERSIQVVLAAFPAEKYAWDDPKSEADFKQKKNDQNATLYPAPELLIVKKDAKGEKTSANYVLAWRLYIFAKKPYIAQAVYVDAQTGEILRSKSLDLYCNPTTITTTYNGDQTVYTDYRTEDCGFTGASSTDYFTIDDCDPDTEIKSYYTADYDDFDYGEDWLICDEDNDWIDYTSNGMILTSLWAVRQAYNYYVNVHGHTSFDGSDGLIDVFNGRTYFDDDGDPYCSNANFTNIIDNLNFGAGSDCNKGTDDDYNTLDIVGHEYTHGVIEYAHADALDYSDESGALNESFADIFGEMVEHYIEGGVITWLHGEDKSTGPGRSFIDPNDKGDPDTYFGDYWAGAGVDEGTIVHTNSGVQNHMFYLLSEGGSGTNDHGIDYNVEGIGFDHARDIAWQAMMNYMDGDDGYITDRNAWIQSAIDLFGSCSQEVISVGQAFQAVGVTEYTAFDLAGFCGTYSTVGFADATYGIQNSNLLLGMFTSDCTTTINSPAIVSLESGYYVQLNPGFTAKSGCTFVAMIDECEISDYDAGDLKYVSPDPETASDNIAKDPAFTLYPVPADQSINISFSLDKAAAINISVMDLSGRKIADWFSGQSMTGNEPYTFSTADLTNGIYLCSLRVNGEVYTNKFIVQH